MNWVLHMEHPIIKRLTLIFMFQNNEIDDEIRVQALEALSRSTCQRNNKKGHQEHLWKILYDFDEDINIRISAFRALLPCFSQQKPYKFFNRIRHLLQEEKVNQGKNLYLGLM